MITKSKQAWEVGQAVNVGFLKDLTVVAKVATPRDFAPDAYVLANKTATQLYKFVPHNGIEKVSLLEARELIADAKAHADRVAAKAIAQASEASRTIAALNEAIFA
ncbi:hypothetical protein ACUXAV_000683 [Cupriavidus metallidurans]|uniref:hypothetical protein n=1 Tax=Cupriavidus metallidurans TaxID=119219 RepID=UPI0004933BCD|nr:hypothetical protein [Cupriavidus metallidurans]MDE4918584.1 hypothetical protein [Cupriavidus metallidurans]